MSITEPVVPMTVDQFIAWEQGQEVRHELVDGRAYAMAGGSERHDLMKGALYRRAYDSAVRSGCRAFTDRRLRLPSNRIYYPDVMVVCGRPPEVNFEDDAAVVAEVLSGGTRATDRREKVSWYAQLPSIEAYLLVEPDIRRVEVVTWDGGTAHWDVIGPGDLLFVAHLEVSVDELYDDVDQQAGGS
jgi:Uma2 family endonuclease